MTSASSKFLEFMFRIFGRKIGFGFESIIFPLFCRRLNFEIKASKLICTSRPVRNSIHYTIQLRMLFWGRKKPVRRCTESRILTRSHQNDLSIF
jgi:hypothetical protein